MISYLILRGMALLYLKGDVLNLRVGIFTDKPVPETGGAYTFLDTIIRDIVSFNCEYEFYIFFYDSNAPKRYNKNLKTKIFPINRTLLLRRVILRRNCPKVKSSNWFY